MRITVKRLREMVQRSIISEKNDLRKSEMFDAIEYNPDAQDITSSFVDRWGNTLPSKPDSLKSYDVRNWLEANNVNTISVRGKKMSIKNFVNFIDMMGKKHPNIPVIKGAMHDEEKSTKTGEIPVVRGAPVKKKRRQFSEEPPNEFFSAWPT